MYLTSNSGLWPGNENVRVFLERQLLAQSGRSRKWVFIVRLDPHRRLRPRRARAIHFGSALARSGLGDRSPSAEPAASSARLN